MTTQPRITPLTIALDLIEKECQKLENIATALRAEPFCAQRLANDLLLRVEIIRAMCDDIKAHNPALFPKEANPTRYVDSAQ